MRGALHLSAKARERAEETEEKADVGLLESGGEGTEIRPSRVCTIPLWQAKWPRDTLLAHWRTMTDNAISRGYRQVPVSDTDLLFHSKWVDEALDPQLILQDLVDKDSEFFKMRRYAGCDIAVGETAASAFWVLMTIAIHPKTKHRYVINIRRYRGLSLTRQFGMLKDVYDATQWETCGVESNGIQKGIVDHYGEGKIIPTKPIYTGAVQKRDEELGIPAMAGEFEHGQWHIPYGNATSKRLMEPFIEELKSYPTGSFTDTVMAAFFARQVSLLAPKGRMTVDVIRY